MVVMDSGGVGRASKTMCNRSGLAIVSSHGVGLESAPLSWSHSYFPMLLLLVLFPPLWVQL